RNFLAVLLRDALVVNRAQVGLTQQTEPQFLASRSGIKSDGNVNQPETDAALPDCARHIRVISHTTKSPRVTMSTVFSKTLIDTALRGGGFPQRKRPNRLNGFVFGPALPPRKSRGVNKSSTPPIYAANSSSRREMPRNSKRRIKVSSIKLFGQDA